MKRWLFMVLLFVLDPVYAEELKSFQEIYDSVKQGKNIKFVINFENCIMKSPISNLTIFISPRAIMLRQNYLKFSHSPMTLNNPNFPDQPIIENVSYKLTSESLNMTIKFLSLPNYTVVGETNAVCPLNKSVKVLI